MLRMEKEVEGVLRWTKRKDERAEGKIRAQRSRAGGSFFLRKGKGCLLNTSGARQLGKGMLKCVHLRLVQQDSREIEKRRQ